MRVLARGEREWERAPSHESWQHGGTLTFYRVTVVKGTQTSRELRGRRVLKALKFPQLLSSPMCPAAAAAAEAADTGPWNHWSYIKCEGWKMLQWLRLHLRKKKKKWQSMTCLPAKVNVWYISGGAKGNFYNGFAFLERRRAHLDFIFD